MANYLKRNKKKNLTKKAFHSDSNLTNVIDIFTGLDKGLYQTDPMGASWRAYPRSALRQELIVKINLKPEELRTGDDWWQLG